MMTPPLNTGEYWLNTSGAESGRTDGRDFPKRAMGSVFEITCSVSRRLRLRL